MHLSISERVHNIKIICSIRFSLLITIDRFYKLFCRGCFRESSTFDDLPLFFIPLEPYPARSAHPLPHAGKALSVVILFPKYACIRFDDAGIAVSSYRSLPHWGRGTALAVDRVLSFILDLRQPPLSFIPPEPYPARSARHLPNAGKALPGVLFFHTCMYSL